MTSGNPHGVNDTATPAAPDRETRQRILDSAEALFVNRGFKGVSMRAVAETVQVTQAALYYHFPGGKEELFRETIRRFLDQVVERTFAGVDALNDFRGRLTALTCNALALPFDRLAPLLHDAKDYLGATKADLMRELTGTFSVRAAQLFQEAIEKGEISSEVSADLLARLHLGMCVALRNAHLFAIDEIVSPEDERRVAQTVVAVLLDGARHHATTPST